MHYISSLSSLISLEQLLVFLPAAIALNLTPGSDFLFCLSQGIDGGPRAGVAASLGIAFGSLVYTLLAAFGLAALLKTYPLAFTLLRWAGVCYLIFIALQTLYNPLHKSFTANRSKPGRLLASFRDGVVVNLLNPKVAIFILAFIPQFIEADKGSAVVQFLIFGTIFNITGTIVNATVGVYAGTLGRTVLSHPSMTRWLHYLTGIIYISLAVKLALDTTTSL